MSHRFLVVLSLICSVATVNRIHAQAESVARTASPSKAQIVAAIYPTFKTSRQDARSWVAPPGENAAVFYDVVVAIEGPTALEIKIYPRKDDNDAKQTESVIKKFFPGDDNNPVTVLIDPANTKNILVRASKADLDKITNLLDLRAGPMAVPAGPDFRFFKGKDDNDAKATAKVITTFFPGDKMNPIIVVIDEGNTKSVIVRASGADLVRITAFLEERDKQK